MTTPSSASREQRPPEADQTADTRSDGDVATSVEAAEQRWGVRLAFGLSLVLLAGILVVSGLSQPAEEDARVGGRVELVELIRAEEARAEALQSRVDELAAEVAAAEERAHRDPEFVDVLRAQIDEIGVTAGLTAVRGPGMRATLTDSSLSEAPSGDPNDLVIHEEDLQAVINALWAGGAEAMSVQGHRVTATTAIRCVGNTLLLHGQVYSPPFEIEAVGDPEALAAALERDPGVERFEVTVREHELGYEVEIVEGLRLPAAELGSGLQVAQPEETS